MKAYIKHKEYEKNNWNYFLSCETDKLYLSNDTIELIHEFFDGTTSHCTNMESSLILKYILEGSWVVVNNDEVKQKIKKSEYLVCETFVKIKHFYDEIAEYVVTLSEPNTVVLINAKTYARYDDQKVVNFMNGGIIDYDKFVKWLYTIVDSDYVVEIYKKDLTK